ncbi:peptidylprolyl isomerase [Roseibium aggregatum]|uniref:Parvulin-like PPIase n=1 Tax=Roseibium aggregatum TaxID=187304 RepID=A0A939EEI9_9HYPH|nr:peptidylprolyl isomerase [Roseibium aggregatum]MBN9670688.1 SurA N-terminal domain-containing protein [Roseibium aggregatum]
MLDALRKGAGTWVAKLFIALLIFSFAVWGISGFLTGVGQNTAARVGDTEVTLFDFDRTYRQDLNRLGQQFGRQLTPSEGAALGIPQQSLGKLVAEAALNNTATQMKLGVSDEQLATIIQTDPAFQGLNGRYDRTRLQQVLRSNGYTEDEYVVQRRKVAERAQIAEGLAGGVEAPKSYLEALSAYQSETRSVNYLLVTAETVGEIEDPASDALTVFFEDNKSDFKAPEFREIKFVTLSPDALARPQDIDDAMARAEYERRADDFFQPERRKVRQMSFPSAEAAEEAAKELEAGKTFDQLMSDRNLTGNDVALGVMAKADFLDETLGEAAFSLEEGASSGAVDGRFSTVILNVEEVLPEATKPFEDVREEIVAELAKDQADREILDLVDEIEDARAGGAMLDEIADRFSLTVVEPEAFDASGKTISGGSADLPNADGLVSGTFDSDIGIENDVLQIGNQGYLWYEVAKVIPERDRALEEVKDDAIAAWKASELEKRLTETAGDLLKQLESGTALTNLAATTELELKSAEGLTRANPAGDFGQAALSEVFSGPVGTNATTEAADGKGRLVFQVTGTNIPEFSETAAETAALATQLSQQLQDSLLGQFISDQETKAGVEINQAAIAQIIGLDQN